MSVGTPLAFDERTFQGESSRFLRCFPAARIGLIIFRILVHQRLVAHFLVFLVSY